MAAFTLAGCTAVLSLCPCNSANCADTRGALNVIFILADDMGWADAGCYGADLHETPHIDALARQGVRFTQAYAGSSVCTPTRACILAGKYPARLHMTVWREAAKTPPRNR